MQVMMLYDQSVPYRLLGVICKHLHREVIKANIAHFTLVESRLYDHVVFASRIRYGTVVGTGSPTIQWHGNTRIPVTIDIYLTHSMLIKWIK